MEIELEDENPITLHNAYPITDAEASLLPSYTFTVKNKCNTMLEYDVNLDIMESKDSEGVDNRLSSSYVAIEFNGEEKKLLNTLESVETSYPKTDYTPVEGRYLVSGTLDSNESKSYSLKLWMDEHVTVEDDAMNKNFISKVVVTAKQSHVVRLADYVMSDNETEEFKHEATYQTPALTDYRYVGANPNNYVCFGSEEEVCPSDNLYRIIGVIPTQSTVNGDYENRVKLIKANNWIGNTAEVTPYAKEGKGYRWNTYAKSNAWESSSIKDILNTEYYNDLGEYQNYIAPSVWYLGSPTGSYVAPNWYLANTNEELYTIERSNIQGYSKGNVNYVNNIGLMYPSDYGYSIGSDYKNQSSFENSSLYVTNAWLYNDNEWMISVEKVYANDNGPMAFLINTNVGYISYTLVNYYDRIYGVRPTFYLKSNTIYKSGNGSQEDPFRISINE